MRLGVILALSTLFSFVAAFSMFVALNAFSAWLLNNRIFTESSIRRSARATMQEFSSFIRENAVSATDTESIQAWVDTQRDLILVVYDEQASSKGFSVYSSIGSAEASYALLEKLDARYINEFVVSFIDSGYPFFQSYERETWIHCIYYPQYRWQRVATGLSLGICFLLFTGLLLLLIHRKVNYIALLNREVGVMQGGDFSHPMTIKGHDELTSLAKDMEAMRLSFAERLETESAMRKANANLVTAMSHDLRTPLTALIGYLDIIDLGRYASQEELLKYVHSSKLKAYQIKEMSDKLFEYALVYGQQDEQLDTEAMDAGTVIGQYVEEGVMMLESQGFQVTVIPPDASQTIRLNTSLMHRVFDNVFSNVRKYGDRAKPVSVRFALDADGIFTVQIRNAIGERPNAADSSGVGLKTCEKIMQQHGGSFETRIEHGEYLTLIHYATCSC